MFRLDDGWVVRKIITIIILIAGYLGVYAQVPAFPTAEGYGMWASGGRGGKVVEVTNTLDYDPSTETPIPGSLRYVVSTSDKSQPLTVVFRVSGIITSQTRYLELNRSNVTYAGQTAPGGGICFRGAKVKISGNNVIVRHLRFRVGDELGLSLSAVGTENYKRIIMDHCSMSWSVEENHTFYDNDSTTVQYCILSEGLYNSYNVKGTRSYASQWGGEYASYHHNLIAHCAMRSPRFNGSRSVGDANSMIDFRNNVLFNWFKASSSYGGEVGIAGGSCRMQLVNNYYKPGPATITGGNYFLKPSVGDFGYGKWYLSGNVMANSIDRTNDNWKGVSYSVSDFGTRGVDSIRSTQLFDEFPMNTQTAEDAYTTVINGVGATYPARDSVDLRLIAEIKGERAIVSGGTFGTGKGIIDSPTDVGGWPAYISTSAPVDDDHDGMADEWETANGLDPSNPDDRNKVTKSGYTALEVYLNSLVGENIDLVYPGVGIRSLNQTQAKIFVDNSSNELVILSNENIKQVELFDLNGRLIQSCKDSHISKIDIATLSRGVYVVKVSNGNGGFYRSKFAKMN